MGVLTLAPLSSTPGLQSLGLQPNGEWRWYDLEGERTHGLVAVFAGEVLARLIGLRPLIHRVVRQPVERISMPYFQRTPAEHRVGGWSDGGGRDAIEMRNMFQMLKQVPYNVVGFKSDLVGARGSGSCAVDHSLG